MPAYGGSPPAETLRGHTRERTQDLTNHAAAQGEKLQAIAERSASVAATVDAIEVSVKSTDVVAHTTGVKVDELAERLQARAHMQTHRYIGADGQGVHFDPRQIWMVYMH